MYIKFDLCIQLDDDLLSSIQYRINDDNKLEKKTRLPFVLFNEDCICLEFGNIIQDKDEFAYTIDDCKIFHFHKNEKAKKHGQIQYFDIQPYENFVTKDTMQTLYRHQDTYLSNIGDTYQKNPSQLPLAVCGINVFKHEKDQSCLCCIGCCSPYGMIDECETKNLEQDIFPQFNLGSANNKNEENIIK